MTKKSAEEFMKKIETDSVFRKEFLKAKTREEKTKFLEKNNFHFTKEESVALIQKKYNLTPENAKKLMNNKSGELSKEELEKLFGGRLVMDDVKWALAIL